MKLVFDPAMPIYTQIMEGFKREICSGALAPASKVPPVRELALDLGVNPNTLQRALSELEREGLLFTERTAGRFVTGDEALIARTRRQLTENLTGEYLSKMTELGCTIQEIIEQISEKGNDRHE